MGNLNTKYSSPPHNNINRLRIPIEVVKSCHIAVIAYVKHLMMVLNWASQRTIESSGNIGRVANYMKQSEFMVHQRGNFYWELVKSPYWKHFRQHSNVGTWY